MNDSDIKVGAHIKSIYTKTTSTIVGIYDEWVICTSNRRGNVEGKIHVLRENILAYWELDER